MEKIESTTKCAADQIRQILNKLEKKNREIVLESIVKEEEDEVRPAGITRPILNNSEVASLLMSSKNTSIIFSAL